MQGESFRFIHASDFHLENPLGELDSLPSHIRDVLTTAPWEAAKEVFEAALAENVDFVVLCGDLLNPTTAGPRGLAMLLEYFDRLNQKSTPVFWAAGIADDPSQWPESATLPSNVTLFSKDTVMSVPVMRGDRTLCHVVGRSCDGRNVLNVPGFTVEPTDHFTVGVGYGSSDADALAEGRFDYWALGGKHNRHVVDGGATAGAIYCGAPQGRDFNECGPHGYTIVDVDADQNARIHEIECDKIRYCHVDIDAAELGTASNVKNLMGERVSRLMRDNAGRHLLIGWDISVANGDMLQMVGDSEELLTWARREYGHGSPAAWTLDVRVRPPHSYPQAWFDEETILGDFLRVTAEHSKKDSRDINLSPFTEEHEGILSTTATLLAEVSSSNRKEIMDQATLLGVELLRGGKPQLVQKS